MCSSRPVYYSRVLYSLHQLLFVRCFLEKAKVRPIGLKFVYKSLCAASLQLAEELLGVNPKVQLHPRGLVRRGVGGWHGSYHKTQ
jgi:hypothetical protein